MIGLSSARATADDSPDCYRHNENDCGYDDTRNNGSYCRFRSGLGGSRILFCKGPKLILLIPLLYVLIEIVMLAPVTPIIFDALHV